MKLEMMGASAAVVKDIFELVPSSGLTEQLLKLSTMLLQLRRSPRLDVRKANAFTAVSFFSQWYTMNGT